MSQITRTVIDDKLQKLPPVTIQSQIIPADDTTPSIKDGAVFITSANTGATAITDLDDVEIGQVVTLIGGSDSNASTIADSGNFNLSAAITLQANNLLTVYVLADNQYIELSRSINHV